MGLPKCGPDGNRTHSAKCQTWHAHQIQYWPPGPQQKYNKKLLRYEEAFCRHLAKPIKTGVPRYKKNITKYKIVKFLQELTPLLADWASGREK